MSQTVLELLIAPVLVAVSTLSTRRWGARAGGVVSAFPAIVGPVLLIGAQQHGTLFAARAANGTLLGLVALSGFVLAYGRVAELADWPTSIVAGWALAALLAVGVYLAARDAGSPAGLLVGGISLVLAHRALPHGGAAGLDEPPAHPRGDIPLRMVLTALLVASLTLAADRFGPFIGGALAALPVLASVLAVFTHRLHGPATLIDLLRGMLAGMLGFVAFCQVLALLIVPAGTAAAFAVAVLVAAAASVLTAATPIRRYARLRFG